MTRPTLPPTPNIRPCSPAEADQVLRKWALDFAADYAKFCLATVQEKLYRAKDAESRLRYPDTTGS